MTTDLLTPPTRTWTPEDLEILDAATRREFLAMLGAAGLLVACGDGGRDAEDDAGASSATRTVEGAFGPVVVPAEPARLFVADFADAEGAIALGVTPLARWRYDARSAPRQVRQWAEDAATIDGPDGFNLEQLASLDPDLILTADYYAEAPLEKLQAIAPVAAYRGDDQDPFSGDWKQHLRFVAAVLGRGARAEELLAAWDERASRFRDELTSTSLGSGSGVVVSVLRFNGDSFSAYLLSSFSGAVLDDLGLVRPEAQAIDTPGSSSTDLSLEQLDQADGDLLAVFASGEDVTSDAGVGALVASPIGATLRAVENGRVLSVDPGHWFFGSIEAAHLILDDLAAALGVVVER